MILLVAFLNFRKGGLKDVWTIWLSSSISTTRTTDPWSPASCCIRRWGSSRRTGSGSPVFARAGMWLALIMWHRTFLSDVRMAQSCPIPCMTIGSRWTWRRKSAWCRIPKRADSSAGVSLPRKKQCAGQRRRIPKICALPICYWKPARKKGSDWKQNTSVSLQQ